MLKILITCPGSDDITDKGTSPSEEGPESRRIFFLNFKLFNLYRGIDDYFPGGSDGKRIRLQCGRPGFDPWVGKIPWWRQPLPTPLLLPREFQGQRTLVGYSPRGHKESDTTEWLSLFMYKINNKNILCSTENCSHYLVITCKCSIICKNTELLLCTPETNNVNQLYFN